jgi:hypothetical protein
VAADGRSVLALTSGKRLEPLRRRSWLKEHGFRRRRGTWWLELDRGAEPAEVAVRTVAGLTFGMGWDGEPLHEAARWSALGPAGPPPPDPTPAEVITWAFRSLAASDPAVCLVAVSRPWHDVAVARTLRAGERLSVNALTSQYDYIKDVPATAEGAQDAAVQLTKCIARRHPDLAERPLHIELMPLRQADVADAQEQGRHIHYRDLLRLWTPLLGLVGLLLYVILTRALS